MVIYKYAHLDCRKCPKTFLSRCTLEQHQIACVAPFSTALKCTETKSLGTLSMVQTEFNNRRDEYFIGTKAAERQSK